MTISMMRKFNFQSSNVKYSYIWKREGLQELGPAAKEKNLKLKCILKKNG